MNYPPSKRQVKRGKSRNPRKWGICGGRASDHGKNLQATGNPHKDKPWHYPAKGKPKAVEQRRPSTAERVLLLLLSGDFVLPDGMAYAAALERVDAALGTLPRGYRSRALHEAVWPHVVTAVMAMF